MTPEASSTTRARAVGLLRPLPLLLMAALVLRLVPWLAGSPLHHDEALYGSWARLIATGQDPLLLTTWLDKPPLTLYFIAASFRVLGVSELTLRLPGMLAGMLLVPATYGLARRAYGAPASAIAALLIALSPFAIAFAPTAFTDGWLTLWLVSAAWAALAGRSFAAGLLLGLAVASKQQGLLAIPLILPLLALGGAERQSGRAFLRALGLAVLGFALPFGPLHYWDSLRWHNRPSFWDRSLQTYGPLVLAPLADWPARAASWAAQLRLLFGLPLLSWGALVIAGGAAVHGVLRWRHERAARFDALLGAYVVGYLILHVIVTFQPWDRYLLPIVPLVAILVAQAAVRSTRSPRAARLSNASLRRLRRVGASPLMVGSVGVILAAALLCPAAMAASGRLPIGSNGGAYEGVATAATFIRGQEPDAIVYYRRLGWHFDFYLFDAPQERRWYGDGAKLATDAGQTCRDKPERAQWLALPAWEQDSLPELEAALARQALRLETGARVPTAGGETAITLYRLIPQGSHAEARP